MVGSYLLLKTVKKLFVMKVSCYHQPIFHNEVHMYLHNVFHGIAQSASGSFLFKVA